MTRPSFLNTMRYLVTMMDLILTNVLSDAPGFGLRVIPYLHILSYATLTALQIPTSVW